MYLYLNGDRHIDLNKSDKELIDIILTHHVFVLLNIEFDPKVNMTDL